MGPTVPSFAVGRRGLNGVTQGDLQIASIFARLSLCGFSPPSIQQRDGSLKTRHFASAVLGMPALGSAMLSLDFLVAWPLSHAASVT